MLIAHEIGHNFGLRHPFDNHEGEGDLKLKQRQTLENIMDYLPDAEETCKSFITYQWEKMRTFLSSNKDSVEELGLKASEDSQRNGFLYLEDFSNSVIKDVPSNLSAFSNEILKRIENYNYVHHGNSVEVQNVLTNPNFQKELLETFIKPITNEINKLCN